jgi:hypothetical protein
MWCDTQSTASWPKPAIRREADRSTTTAGSKPRVFDVDGRPPQMRGVSPVPACPSSGLHWIHTFKSGLFSGVGSDAECLAERVGFATGRERVITGPRSGVLPAADAARYSRDLLLARDPKQRIGTWLGAQANWKRSCRPFHQGISIGGRSALRMIGL